MLLAGEGPKQEELLKKVVEKAAKIEPGTGPGHLGPVIDAASHKKILGYIEAAENGGAEILLDGRKWLDMPMPGGGCWIGPTIIKHNSPDDAAMKEEVFGPVLSVYTVSSWTEAIEIENANPFGNAACVYTTNGGYADWFIGRFRAAMLGIFGFISEGATEGSVPALTGVIPHYDGDVMAPLGTSIIPHF